MGKTALNLIHLKMFFFLLLFCAKKLFSFFNLQNEFCKRFKILFRQFRHSCVHTDDRRKDVDDGGMNSTDLITTSNVFTSSKNWLNPASFCLFSSCSQYNDTYGKNIDYIKVQMVCLGFEPGFAGRQARTIHRALGHSRSLFLYFRLFNTAEILKNSW